jgi:hypothetical protein
MKKSTKTPSTPEFHEKLRLGVRDLILADRAQPGKSSEHLDQISKKYGLNRGTLRTKLAAIRKYDLTDEALALNVRVESAHHSYGAGVSRDSLLINPVIECPLTIESMDSTRLSPRVRELLTTLVNNPNSDVLNTITDELKYI